MRLQQLKETTLGLLIVGLHEGEAPTGKFGLLFWPPSKCQDALARDHLEIPLLAVAAHIAAINAHREWTFGVGRLAQSRGPPSMKQSCSSPSSFSNRSATSRT